MSFFGELRRRNVFRMGIAYLAAVWVLIEVADTLVSIINAPAWIPQVLVYSAALGFPLALVLAWFYELTSEGIKASADVEAVESVKFMGRKLDFAIIGLLVVAVGFLLVANYAVEEPERSIAALPFSNESATEENAEFFANGIHDELLTQLAKIGSLKVISRTSVMEYRNSQKNMRQIGQELNVATILEGGVQRAGDMVRINVQLIDAETDEHLWAEVYDRELTAENIFAIQREMATAIAEALQTTLSPQEVARLNEVPTRNVSAYNFYLSGNDYIRRPDNMTAPSLAAQQYRRAVDEDPDFALAWAGLARAHSGVYFFRVDPSESRHALAQEAIERAFELAPDLPEAHLAMGFFHYHGNRDYENALKEFAIAETGMPGDSLVYLAQAYVYRRMSAFERAAVNLDRATDLDPRNLEQLLATAMNYGILRQYASVEEYLNRVLDIAPDATIAHFNQAAVRVYGHGDISLAKLWAENPPDDLGNSPRWLGWIAAIYDRDYDAALAYLDDWKEDPLGAATGAGLVWQNFYAPKASYLGVTYQLAGRPEQADAQFQIAREQIEEALEGDPANPRLLLALGELLTGLGEHEAAIDAAYHAMEALSTSQDAVEGRAYQLAAIIRVLVPAGDFDAAIEELDDYLASPGFWSIEGLLPDPRLDPLRDNLGFQELVEKYRRREWPLWAESRR